MRILYAGCPDISVPPLVSISRNFEIIGVLTNPDRRCGRNRRVRETPVKAKALEMEIPVFEAAVLGEAEKERMIEAVESLAPDILVVFAYGIIFPRWFLDLFPKGGINAHPSLLPRFRGPSPISAALLAGDKETGITIQRIAQRMDSGNILLQEVIPLTGRETTADVEELAAEKIGPHFCTVLGNLEEGTQREYPQDEEKATYCGFLAKEDGIISWADSADTIDRMVRAFFPWPKARTIWEGRELILLEGEGPIGDLSKLPASSAGKPGSVVGVDKNRGILIQTGNGIYAVRTLQLHSKKPLAFKDFLNGNRGFENAVLGVE